MDFNRRNVLASGFAAAMLLAASPAAAQSADQAEAHVQATIDELVALLRQSGTAESRAPRLRQIMETRGNLPLIAKFSAGRVWREMSEEQQRRFVEAFSDYVAVTYSRRFDEYSGNPDIRLGRTIDAGQKGILVETPVRQGQGEPISVEWLVSDRGGRVEIVDIVIENVSMATTQREEIGAMFQKHGQDVEALIQDLASSG